jgi:plastocyanin domain-containing protein
MSDDGIKIKKSNLYIILTILLVLGVGAFMLNGRKSDNNTSTNSVQNSGGGEIQQVVLSIKNYNYYPNTITVKIGVPVRISLDKTVVGCYRGFVMRDFGINKYLQTPNDYVEFTPTKKGTYRFACSMGMGTGVLIVE